MKKLWQLTGIIAFWVSWPALWFYLRGTHRTRVVITAGDKVLLVKGWLGSGQWILPGGGTHRGENPLQAAAREVKEETGLALDPVLFNTLDTFQVRECGIPYKITAYVVELKDTQSVQRQRLEVSEVAWVAKADLQNLSPFTQRALANWS